MCVCTHNIRKHWVILVRASPQFWAKSFYKQQQPTLPPPKKEKFFPHSLNLKECFYRPAHCLSSLWKIRKDNCFDGFYRKRQFPWFHFLTKNSYLTWFLPHVSKFPDVKISPQRKQCESTELSWILTPASPGSARWPSGRGRRGTSGLTVCMQPAQWLWLSGWLLLCHRLIWLVSPQKKKKKQCLPVFYNILS